MSERGYALFDTAIGCCGIGWTPRGIAGVSLPDASEPAGRARLARRAQGDEAREMPPEVAEAVSDIRALLDGRSVGLSGVALDEAGAPAFDLAVYAVARSIPRGGTLTYGEVAARLGDPQLARAVGQALGRNPWPIIVPCHRVLAAGGGAGGFSARGGIAVKLRMLSIEQAATSPEPLLFDALPLAGRA